MGVLFHNKRFGKAYSKNIICTGFCLSVLVSFFPVEITFKDMFVCNLSVYVSIDKLDPA